MTDAWTWTLITGLILLAVTTSIKAVTESVKSKGLEKQLSTVRGEIKVLERKQNEETNKVRKVHAAEIDKLAQRVTQLEQQVQSQNSGPPDIKLGCA